jgi:hypothetical protein
MCRLEDFVFQVNGIIKIDDLNFFSYLFEV